MTRRPTELIYAVDEWPPISKLSLLGLQQVCLAFPYILLCTLIYKTANLSQASAQNSMSMVLIALAIASLLQMVWKGPIGSGFLAPSIISAIYLPATLLAAASGGVALIAGMTIAAGGVEIIMALFLRKLRKFFPPVVSGFIIMAVGLQLGMVALGKIYDLTKYGHPHYTNHLIVAFVTAFAMISFTIWGKGILYLMCSLFGLIIGILGAFLLGLFENSTIYQILNSPWISLPSFNISYSFDYTLLPHFIIAAIASSFRAVGVLTTCQKINDASWRQPNLKNLRKGVFTDGLNCSIGGALGVPGISVSPSLVGLSQVTKATSRYITLAIVGWLILFALLPKVTAFIFGMPDAIVGGALLFTSSFMIIGGIQVISGVKIDLRATFMVGISLLLGISREVFPSYFEELPPILQLFTSSLLSIGTLSILLLNLLFRIKVKKTYQLILEHSKASLTSMTEKFKHQLHTWEISSENINRCISSTNELIKQIAAGNLSASQINIFMHYDLMDVIIEIFYEGVLPPYCNQESTTELVEEQLFTVGLTGFLSEIYPDKLESDIVNRQCKMRLHFYT